MKIESFSKNLSTSLQIVQLGLPAAQQHKALESLALADALMSCIFGDRKVTAEAKFPAEEKVASVQGNSDLHYANFKPSPGVK